MRSPRQFAIVFFLALLFRLDTSCAETLKIPYVSSAGTQLPLFIGEAAGLFRKNQLEAQLIYIPGGSLVIQTMLSGDAGLASLAPPTAMVAWAKGANLVVIAGGIDRLNHMLMVAPRLKKPDDLRGKRVGISRYGSLTDFALTEALRLHKLTPARDVVVVQMGGLAERVAALTSGAVEGVVVQTDQMFLLEKLGYPMLMDFRKLPFSYPTQGILTSSDFARNQRQTAKRFLRAYLEGIKLVKEDSRLTKQVLQKYLKITDPELISKTYDAYRDAFDRVPYVRRDIMSAALRTIPDLASQSSSLNITTFIDNRMMQELETEGFFRDLYPELPNR